MAVSTDFARSQAYLNWEVTFGIYAIWLLISGHHFTIFWGQSCHLAFDFWVSLCLLFHLECDSWLVKFWFGLVLLVWFEWTDIRNKLLKLIWELVTVRFHTPPGNPLGKKKKFDGSIYSCDPMTRKMV